MKFTVEFIRFFDDFGFYDFDTKEFSSLMEAYSFYTSLKNKGEDVRLYQGALGDKNFCRLH